MAKKNNVGEVAVADMNEVEAAKAKRNAASKKSAEKRKALPKYSIPAGGIVKIPADYSSAKFQPLEKEDFATEADYLDHKADKLEASAKRARNAASDARSLGNVKDVAKAKKLLKVAREFAELKAMMLGDDVDVDAILATIAS